MNRSRVRLFATFAAVTLYFSLAPRPAFGQTAGAGRIVGHVDRIVVDATVGPHIKGWACQQGRPESLTVHIYAKTCKGAKSTVRTRFFERNSAGANEDTEFFT